MKYQDAPLEERVARGILLTTAVCNKIIDGDKDKPIYSRESAGAIEYLTGLGKALRCAKGGDNNRYAEQLIGGLQEAVLDYLKEAKMQLIDEARYHKFPTRVRNAGIAGFALGISSCLFYKIEPPYTHSDDATLLGLGGLVFLLLSLIINTKYVYRTTRETLNTIDDIRSNLSRDSDLLKRAIYAHHQRIAEAVSC